MSIILILIFMGIVAMYSAVYPAFKDSLQDMASSLKGDFTFLRGFEYMTTYRRFSQYGIVSDILDSYSWHVNRFFSFFSSIKRNRR